MDLCRRAAMKLDSFITDIYEIKEDEGLDLEDRQTFEQIAAIWLQKKWGRSFYRGLLWMQIITGNMIVIGKWK